jgi:hypothetical protein
MVGVGKGSERANWNAVISRCSARNGGKGLPLFPPVAPDFAARDAFQQNAIGHVGTRISETLPAASLDRSFPRYHCQRGLAAIRGIANCEETRSHPTAEEDKGPLEPPAARGAVSHGSPDKAPSLRGRSSTSRASTAIKVDDRPDATMSVDGTLLRLTSDEILAAPHEVLASLVQRYQDELDQALEQTQAKDDHAARAEEDRARLGKDLDTAKRRIDELLNEQARMEDELSGRIEVLDKLRANVRELEREKKEATKRYREQVSGELVFRLFAVPVPLAYRLALLGRDARVGATSMVRPRIAFQDASRRSHCFPDEAAPQPAIRSSRRFGRVSNNKRRAHRNRLALACGRQRCCRRQRRAALFLRLINHLRRSCSALGDRIIPRRATRIPHHRTRLARLELSHLANRDERPQAGLPELAGGERVVRDLARRADSFRPSARLAAIPIQCGVEQQCSGVRALPT